MQAYLVFDLRNHHFVAGVLDSISGKLRWTSEMILIWQREGIYDSVEEADLCFFRPPREKRWIPISSSALSQLDDSETIVNLFEEQDDRLKTVIKPALGALLRPFLKDRKELEILFLVDSVRVSEHITEIAQKLDRPYRIIIANDDVDLLAGFALLDTEKQQFPKNNKVLTCNTDEGLFSYRWNEEQFESVSADGLRPDSKWHKLRDLQRAGLIAFELLWSNHLIPEHQAELEKIKEENRSIASLLEKLTQISTRLRDFQKVNA
jgi:hypothetical protein